MCTFQKSQKVLNHSTLLHKHNLISPVYRSMSFFGETASCSSSTVGFAQTGSFEEECEDIHSGNFIIMFIICTSHIISHQIAVNSNQGWEFAHLLITHLLISLFCSNQMSVCERFAQIAQDR